MSELISVRAAITDRFGRLAIVQRPSEGEQANKLQFPGGKVETVDGDPLIDPLWLRLRNAVEREVPEETGLEVRAYGIPQLVTSYIIPDGKYVGRTYSSYLLEAEVIGANPALATDLHPTSWWSPDTFQGSGADSFTAATRYGATLLFQAETAGGVHVPASFAA